MSKTFDNEWEKIHSEREWGQYPTEYVVRFIARNFYKMERDKVKILDFCCGAGAHTWFLAREGFDTYAFDGSHSAVERVQKRFEKEKLKADLLVCDALELPYEKASFDGVVDNVSVTGNRMEYIPVMYKEIYDLLKNGGKLITAVFGKKTSGYGTGIEEEKDTFSHMENSIFPRSGVVHFWDNDTIKNMLQEIGFVDVHVENERHTDNGKTCDIIVAIATKA